MSHKLLLADDSVTIQRVIELTFADEDVQVLTAGDGEQAIASIRSERPDIVLADIGMPKRSGYDVAAFVKGEPELSHIPVLLLTGAFEPVDERRAQAAGCDGVLVKPFEPQHVIARVRELLQGVPGGAGRPAGGVTRAVSDVPRAVERLASHRMHPRPAGSDTGERLTARAHDDAGRPAHDAVRPGSDLDDYFDRLDAAFASIATPADTPAPRQAEVMPRREGPVMERDLDWFDPPSPEAASARQTPSSPVASAEDAERSRREAPRPPSHEHVIDVSPVPDPVPVTLASPPAAPSWSAPQPPSIEPPDSPRERAPQPARPAHATASSSSDPTSAIADAFSALLAAEQGDPDAPPVRLPVAGSLQITDELVDEITRRVAERLGSHAVHDIVADLVSRVAERLVRDEIERIRGQHS
jgi:CheY-like chemotaxis protein